MAIRRASQQDRPQLHSNNASRPATAGTPRLGRRHGCPPRRGLARLLLAPLRLQVRMWRCWRSQTCSTCWISSAMPSSLDREYRIVAHNAAAERLGARPATDIAASPLWDTWTSPTGNP